MNLPGPLIIHGSRLRYELDGLPGPQDVDAAGHECTADQGPVGLHEAEHPVREDLHEAGVVEGRSDQVDLLASYVKSTRLLRRGRAVRQTPAVMSRDHRGASPAQTIRGLKSRAVGRWSQRPTDLVTETTRSFHLNLDHPPIACRLHREYVRPLETIARERDAPAKEGKRSTGPMLTGGLAHFGIYHAGQHGRVRRPDPT